MDRCSSETFPECHARYWLWKTVPVLLLITGTCGNIVNIMVLKRPKIRKFSTSIYLICLSFSDLTFLWSSVFTNMIDYTTSIRVKNLHTVFCKTVPWITYVSAGYSVWLLVLLTTERLLMVRCPVFAKTKLTQKNAVIASMILLVLCFLFPAWYTVGYELKTTVVDNITVLNCSFASEGFEEFYLVQWRALILMVLTVIPMMLIICGNLTLIVSLFVQRRKLRRTYPQNANSIPNENEQSSRRKMKSLTKLLLFVSGFFVLTTLPFTLYGVLRNRLDTSSPRAIASKDLWTSVLVMLVNCNFTFNFIFYFISSSMFKQEWNAMVREIFQCVLDFLTTKNDRAIVEGASRSLNTLPTNTQRSSRDQHETLF